MLYFLEAIVTALFMVFSFTQILMPLWNNTKLFPMFRSKRKELKKEITKIREEGEELDLQQNLIVEKQKVEKKKRKTCINNQ